MQKRYSSYSAEAYAQCRALVSARARRRKAQGACQVSVRGLGRVSHRAKRTGLLTLSVAPASEAVTSSGAA
jgi:hypothetical protein